MTSKTLFPTLDTDGWVKTAEKTADYLLTHFFLSEISQTHHFPDDVASFPWLLAKHQNNPSGLISEAKDVLSRYFQKFFDNVEIELTSEEQQGSINIVNLKLFLIFTDMDGIQHNVARLIKYNGLKVSEIIAVING